MGAPKPHDPQPFNPSTPQPRCCSCCHHWGKAPEKRSGKSDFYWKTPLDCVKNKSPLAGVEQWATVLGGSWGCTLAIAYAQARPPPMVASFSEATLPSRSTYLSGQWFQCPLAFSPPFFFFFFSFFFTSLSNRKWVIETSLRLKPNLPPSSRYCPSCLRSRTIRREWRRCSFGESVSCVRQSN